MFCFNSNFVCNFLRKEELEVGVCICLDNTSPQPKASPSSAFIQMINGKFIKMQKNAQ